MVQKFNQLVILISSNSEALTGLQNAVDSQSVMLSGISTSIGALSAATVAGVAISGFTLKKL